jgi:aminoglycoside phosphotransferase
MPYVAFDSHSRHSTINSLQPSSRFQYINMEIWKNEQREFTIDGKTISKRQLRPTELDYPPERLRYPVERIKNEHAALTYLAANTTIPLAKILNFTDDGGGSFTLVTEFVEGVLMEDLDQDKLEAAIEAVEKQIEQDIIPELHKLRRSRIGCVDESLPVIAPPVYMLDEMLDAWPRITSDKDDFVFCHIDFSRHNFLIDPETFKINAVIDWEYAGFFPAWFERPLWRENWWERSVAEEEAYKARVNEFFGISTERAELSPSLWAWVADWFKRVAWALPS